HRLRLDLLSAMVAVLLLELLTASLIFLVLPLVVVILAVPDLVPAVLHWTAVALVQTPVVAHVSLWAIARCVMLPGLILPLGVVAAERQPRYLLYGPFFVFMRIIDAGIALY